MRAPSSSGFIVLAACSGRLLARPWNSSTVVMKLNGQPCDGMSGFKRLTTASRSSSSERFMRALVSKIGIGSTVKYTLTFDKLEGRF